MLFLDDHLEINPPERTFFQSFTSSFFPSKTHVFLFGFPNDEGKNPSLERIGCEKGPFSFRKGLPEIPYPLFRSFDKIALIDAGNAAHDILQEKSSLKTHEITKVKVKELLEKSKKDDVVFVVGGSNDCSVSCFRGVKEAFQGEKIGIISVNAHLNVKECGDLSSSSTFRTISLDQTLASEQLLWIYYFAIQGSQITQKDFDFANSHQGSVLFLDKNIRRFQIDPSHKNLKTQAGQVFESIVLSLSEKVDRIMISFDIDSVDSAFCPGVSLPSVLGGLTDSEAEEIMKVSGWNRKVSLVDLTEFNPAVEDWRTRKFIAILFYWFCEAVSQRK